MVKTEKFEDLLNLNHIAIEQSKINSMISKLKSFEYDFFQEQLLSREQVLDYISDEDLKKYSVFGLDIKEFLDICENDKYIPDENDMSNPGQGQYIIDRLNKTIHVYRYPSFDSRIEDYIKTEKVGNYLEVTHYRSFLRVNKYIKNDDGQLIQKLVTPDTLKMCRGRMKEYFYYNENYSYDIYLINTLRNTTNMYKTYYYNISKNILEKTDVWKSDQYKSTFN